MFSTGLLQKRIKKPVCRITEGFQMYTGTLDTMQIEKKKGSVLAPKSRRNCRDGKASRRIRRVQDDIDIACSSADWVRLENGSFRIEAVFDLEIGPSSMNFTSEFAEVCFRRGAGA